MRALSITPPLLTRQAISQISGSATLSFVGIVYFSATINALHLLRTDVDPIARTTSEYAVGSYGYLMTSAFLAICLASLALAYGLYVGVAPSAISRPGLGLIMLWAIGVLIVMVFPIDPEGTPRTTAGTIHRIVGPPTFLSLSAGAFLVSRRMNFDERWLAVRRPAVLLSLAMLILWILIPLNIALDIGLLGLVQRILLVTLVTWYLLVTARLYLVATARDSNVS